MGIRNNAFALQLKAECRQILLQAQLLGRCYPGTMRVLTQITWSISGSEQFDLCDSLHGEHFRAGAGTGIQQALTEVAPKSREHKSLKVGLGSRAEHRTGREALWAALQGIRGTTRCLTEMGEGKTNTSPAWGKGGGWLVPTYKPKASWKLSKAGGSFSPVLPSAAELPGVS